MSAASSLAANQTADHVQDSRSGLQVSTQHNSAIPISLLQTDVSTLQPSSSIRQFQSSSCSMHPNKLRRS